MGFFWAETMEPGEATCNSHTHFLTFITFIIHSKLHFVRGQHRVLFCILTPRDIIYRQKCYSHTIYLRTYLNSPLLSSFLFVYFPYQLHIFLIACSKSLKVTKTTPTAVVLLL